MEKGRVEGTIDVTACKPNSLSNQKTKRKKKENNPKVLFSALANQLPNQCSQLSEWLCGLSGKKDKTCSKGSQTDTWQRWKQTTFVFSPKSWPVMLYTANYDWFHTTESNQQPILPAFDLFYCSPMPSLHNKHAMEQKTTSEMTKFSLSRFGTEIMHTNAPNSNL